MNRERGRGSVKWGSKIFSSFFSKLLTPSRYLQQHLPLDATQARYNIRKARLVNLSLDFRMCGLVRISHKRNENQALLDWTLVRGEPWHLSSLLLSRRMYPCDFPSPLSSREFPRARFENGFSVGKFAPRRTDRKSCLFA
jgi:hypothetical protein